jgi:hypothetical protein
VGVHVGDRFGFISCGQVVGVNHLFRNLPAVRVVARGGSACLMVIVLPPVSFSICNSTGIIFEQIS